MGGRGRLGAQVLSSYDPTQLVDRAVRRTRARAARVVVRDDAAADVLESDESDDEVEETAKIVRDLREGVAAKLREAQESASSALRDFRVQSSAFHERVTRENSLVKVGAAQAGSACARLRLSRRTAARRRRRHETARRCRRSSPPPLTSPPSVRAP